MNALLVIDVQKDLVAGAYNEVKVLQAINTAISNIRAGGGLIVFIQHCHGTYEPMMKNSTGWQLHEALDATAADIYVEKAASDAFFETDLHAVLTNAELDHIYVTGLQTEFCVDATCRSALSHGYHVTLITAGKSQSVPVWRQQPLQGSSCRWKGPSVWGQTPPTIWKATSKAAQCSI